jgi:hypothetical protein
MLAVALLRAGVNRGHQQRTIDADGVHRGYHLVAHCLRKWLACARNDAIDASAIR